MVRENQKGRKSQEKPMRSKQLRKASAIEDARKTSRAEGIRQEAPKEKTKGRRAPQGLHQW